MLFTIFIILTCTVAGAMFHTYFSAAFAMFAATIVFNYSDSIGLTILTLIGAFVTMIALKYWVNKNINDGIIDFDLNEIQKVK